MEVIGSGHDGLLDEGAAAGQPAQAAGTVGQVELVVLGHGRGKTGIKPLFRASSR